MTAAARQISLLLLLLPALLPAAAVWDSFLQRLRQDVRAEVKFEQTFNEKESGLEIEERGTMLTVFGKGVVVAYEDGRTYALIEKGVYLYDGETEPEFHPWDENIRENPLLWLVGLSGSNPSPDRSSDTVAIFESRPGLWSQVTVTFKNRKTPFPEKIEILDEENNQNIFIFMKPKWKVKATHPLTRYLSQ